MPIIDLEHVSLESVGITEKMVQKQIEDDPSILGLGELELIDKERTQPKAGRLDLLLRDSLTLKRYETELQLGATDESHIIRTIEYWDIERRRYPQYRHTAVIVAEDVTSRFLNVIQLFNGYVPLIALKMSAYKIGDDVGLSFVKVLDEITYGLVDADEPTAEATDRAWWESKASPKSLLDTDALLKLVHDVQPKAIPKYNKYYIGLAIDGVSRNFVAFRPRKGYVIMEFKLPDQADDVKQKLAETGIQLLSYDAQFGFFRINVGPIDLAKKKDVLSSLIMRAWEVCGKP
jgi:hypothetical protein